MSGEEAGNMSDSKGGSDDATGPGEVIQETAWRAVRCVNGTEKT